MILLYSVCLKPDLKNEKGPFGPSSYKKTAEITKAFVDEVKIRTARFVFQVA